MFLYKKKNERKNGNLIKIKKCLEELFDRMFKW